MNSLELPTATLMPVDPARHPGRHDSDPAERQAAELRPLLLAAADLAQLLRVSVATVWRLRARGALPRPTTALGRQLVRWDADEVRRWIAAKMPPLKVWEAINRS